MTSNHLWVQNSLFEMRDDVSSSISNILISHMKANTAISNTSSDELSHQTETVICGQNLAVPSDKSLEPSDYTKNSITTSCDFLYMDFTTDKSLTSSD